VLPNRTAFLLVVATLLAACSAAGGSAMLSATPSARFAVFSGSVDFKGEIAVRGTFKDSLTSRQETCDEYVRGLAAATTLWVVPTPNSTSAVGGHVVSLSAGIPSAKPSIGYLGPGTYTQPSALVADLLIDNASFLPGNEALATITVDSTGSGWLSFSGMVDTSTSAVESGKETWTCISPQAGIASNESPAASPVTGSRGPMLVGTIQVGGDFTITGTFASQAEVEVGVLPTAAPTSSTCAEYAAGSVSAATFVAPEIHTRSEPQLYFRASMNHGYTGPGTYNGGGSPGLTGVAAVTVASSVGGAVTIYNSKNRGITTLTVRPDGSGTITFSHWGSDETRAGIIAGYLYGSVSWTCQATR